MEPLNEEEKFFLNIAAAYAKTIGEEILFAVKPQTSPNINIAVLTNPAILVKRLSSGEYRISEKRTGVYEFVNSMKFYV